MLLRIPTVNSTSIELVFAGILPALLTALAKRGIPTLRVLIFLDFPCLTSASFHPVPSVGFLLSCSTLAPGSAGRSCLAVGWERSMSFVTL